jgi:ABC-2 type transport system ATP-binding protein
MIPAVTANSVTKRFGSIVAVDDLSISVGDGEIVALLGPNGAGKSTLIRILVGLIRPDQGSVERAVDTLPGRPRGKLGYLPEERGLYQDMPILRTLTYFGALQGMPPRQATEVARGWLDRLGLDARGAEKVKALSKGNQQKVQFVASILHRPPLAILDEPFSGLDPVNQELFLDLIRELREAGTTVIFSAHQMTLVERLADRVLLMSRGREVLHGTIPELRRRWHAGDRLVIGTATDVDTGFLEQVEAVEAVEGHTDGEIRLRLRQGAGISELLRAVGERMEVRYIRSEATTLHEIYVRTVEADLADSPMAEGDAA